MVLAYLWMVSVGSWAVGQGLVKSWQAQRRSLFRLGLRVWRGWQCVGEVGLVDWWWLAVPP